MYHQNVHVLKSGQKQPGPITKAGQRMGKAASMVHQSKAGSFAAFLSGQDQQQQVQQQIFHHQRGQQFHQSQPRPCADPRCTPENAQVPVYYQDLESGKNFCFVCWDGMRTKRIGLSLSLEDMERIGVSSFNGAPKVTPNDLKLKAAADERLAKIRAATEADNAVLEAGMAKDDAAQESTPEEMEEA